jgi:hypothetical protein
VNIKIASIYVYGKEANIPLSAYSEPRKRIGRICFYLPLPQRKSPAGCSVTM